MAVDPSIALSVKPVQLDDPLQKYAQVQTLRNAMQQNEIQGMQAQQLRTQLGENEAFKSALADPNTWTTDAAGNRTMNQQALNNLFGVAPTHAAAMAKSLSDAQYKQAQIQHLTGQSDYLKKIGAFREAEARGKTLDQLHQISVGGSNAYNAWLQQHPGDEQGAIAAGTQAQNQAAQEVYSTGGIDAQHLQQITQNGFNPQNAARFQSDKTRIDQQRADQLGKHYDDLREYYKNGGKNTPHYITNRDGVFAVRPDGSVMQIQDADGKPLDGRPISFAEQHNNEQIEEARRYILQHPPTEIRNGKEVPSRTSRQDQNYWQVLRKAGEKKIGVDDPAHAKWSGAQPSAPAGTKSATSHANPVLPAEAKSAIARDGQWAKFNNGQTWINHGGKEYQLQEGEDTELDDGGIMTLENGVPHLLGRNPGLSNEYENNDSEEAQ